MDIFKDPRYLQVPTNSRWIGRFAGHVTRVYYALYSRVPSVLRRAWIFPATYIIEKMFKPFKPPLLRKVEKPAPIDLTESDLDPEEQHRPSKKRRLLVRYVEDSPPRTLPVASAAVNAPRKPLLVTKKDTDLNESAPVVPEGPEGYYLVLWYVEFCNSRRDN